MNFGLVQCICEQCNCRSKCEYFKETIEPIVKAVGMTIAQDEFTSNIRYTLRNFKCEYYE